MTLQEIKDKFIKAIEKEEGRLSSALLDALLDSDNIRDSVAELFDKSNGRITADIKELFIGILAAQKNITFDADSDILKQANAKALDRLGIADNGKVIKNGLVDLYIQNSQSKAQLIEIVNRSIDAGASKSDLKINLEKFLGGKLVGHYNTMANDAIKISVNYRDKIVADKLGLVFFRYSGTERDTSREFCLKRKNGIFHVSDFDEWKKMEGDEDGPIWSDTLGEYDPATDVGGINCVDRLLYLSTSLVKVKNPEVYKKYQKFL